MTILVRIIIYIGVCHIAVLMSAALSHFTGSNILPIIIIISTVGLILYDIWRNIKSECIRKKYSIYVTILGVQWLLIAFGLMWSDSVGVSLENTWVSLLIDLSQN